MPAPHAKIKKLASLCSKILAAGYLLALGFIACSKSLGLFTKQHHAIELFFGGDKLLHLTSAFLLYLSLYLLLFSFLKKTAYNIILTVSILILLALEEGLHYFLPQRDFDVEDFLAGALGVSIACIAITLGRNMGSKLKL